MTFVFLEGMHLILQLTPLLGNVIDMNDSQDQEGPGRMDGLSENSVRWSRYWHINISSFF